MSEGGSHGFGRSDGGAGTERGGEWGSGLHFRGAATRPTSAFPTKRGEMQLPASLGVVAFLSPTQHCVIAMAWWTERGRVAGKQQLVGLVADARFDRPSPRPRPRWVLRKGGAIAPASCEEPLLCPSPTARDWYPSLGDSQVSQPDADSITCLRTAQYPTNDFNYSPLHSANRSRATPLPGRL